MPHLSTPTSTVHFERDGTGPALVLVHGVGGEAEMMFGHVTPELARSRTVLRPNLSGSGETTDGGGDLSVDGLADQVAAVAHEVDGPVDLLGFSLGAGVSVAVAARHPELVRRLVLVGGWVHSRSPRDTLYLQTWRALLDADRDLFKRFSSLTGMSPATLDGFGHDGIASSLADAWPPPGIARQIEVAQRLDVRDRLAEVTAPTLVVALGGDSMIPPTGSRQLHAGIAGSRLVELEGEGHMDWLATPEPLMRVVRDFLDA